MSKTKCYVGLLLVCFISGVIGGDDQFRSYLYSRYGLENYRRLRSQGTFQGTMSRLACSRLCSDLSSCQAFQNSRENGKLVCHTFTSYTHLRMMEPSENSNYYEKNTCTHLFDTTATIIYRDVQEMFMITHTTLRKMRFTKLGHQYTFSLYWRGPVSEVFPSFGSSVEAMTEFYGNYTVLLNGNTSSCYSRNGTNFTFQPCPADLFSAYFNLPGISNMDAITQADDSLRDLYIFKTNNVYHMSYDVNETRYLLNKTESLTDPESPWSEAPNGITAAAFLGNDSYFVFESYKWYFYYTSPIKRISTIVYVCS